MGCSSRTALQLSLPALCMTIPLVRPCRPGRAARTVAPQLRPAAPYLSGEVLGGSAIQEQAVAAAAIPTVAPQAAAPAAAQHLAEALLDDEGSARGGGGGGGMQPPALSAQTTEPDVAVQLEELQMETTAASAGEGAAPVESLIAAYADEWRLSLEEQQRQPFQPPPLTALRRPVPVIIDLETTGGWVWVCVCGGGGLL